MPTPLRSTDCRCIRSSAGPGGIPRFAQAPRRGAFSYLQERPIRSWVTADSPWPGNSRGARFTSCSADVVSDMPGSSGLSGCPRLPVRSTPVRSASLARTATGLSVVDADVPQPIAGVRTSRPGAPVCLRFLVPKSLEIRHDHHYVQLEPEAVLRYPHPGPGLYPTCPRGFGEGCPAVPGLHYRCTDRPCQGDSPTLFRRARRRGRSQETGSQLPGCR